MVSALAKSKNEIKHYSINSCITPILSLHGLAVTTVEGIGNLKGGVHPVQERIAKAHGVQCGYCTPGFVMSMYTLLKNVPQPEKKQVEEAFHGNICRCTGYRSILSGCYTFCKNNKTVDIEELSLGDGSNLYCKKSFDASDWKNYKTCNGETIPLKSLKIDEEFQHEKKGKCWIRAESIQHLTTLKFNHPEAPLIAGSTELSVEKLTKKEEKSAILIHVPHYLDNTIEQDGNCMIVGCSTTLTDLEDYVKNHDRDFNTFEAIEECLKYFGSNQIRNVATVSGNVYTSSPISDLIPILVATKSSVILKSKFAERKVYINEDFFTGYRKNVIEDIEIISKFIIPMTLEKNEYIRFYKQAKRKYDDISIINACFYVKLTNDQTIEDIRIVYGGISFRVVEATQTSEKLIGLKWNKKMSETATCNLIKELFITKGSPGGEETYRNNLLLSLYFKFYLDVCQKLDGFKHENSVQTISGIQLFDAIPGENTIGKSLSIPAALKHTTGESDFICDMPKFENELIIYPIICPIACAKFNLKNREEILRMEGVIDIWDWKVFYDCWKWKSVSYYVSSIIALIATDETIYAGQPIYFVIATDLAMAEKAGILMEIEYNRVETPLLTVDDAIAANSFHKSKAYPSIELGDVEEEFKRSDEVLVGEVNVGKQEHFYMETQSALAVPRDGDALDVYSSTQNVGGDHRYIASILDKPQHLINVICKRCGGGFGGKENQAITTSIPASLVAEKFKRPTRYIMNRQIDMQVTGGRNPMKAKYKVAFSKSGTIKALEVTIYMNSGYSMECGYDVGIKCVKSVGGGYRIPHMSVNVKFCKTNIVSNTAFRGFGTPQAAIITESIIENIAHKLQLGSDHIREINMLKDGEPTKLCGHASLTSMQNDSLGKCWREMMKLYKVEERKSSIIQFNKENRWKKRGIASTVVEHYIGFNKGCLMQGNALVNIYRDGSIYLSFSGVEMGQGLNAKMQQVASSALNVEYDRIYIPDTSSYCTPNSTITAASCGTDVNGFAVLDACQKLNRRLNGVREKFPNASWEEIVEKAYIQQINLSASGHHKFEIFQNQDKNKSGDDGLYVVWGTSTTEVEIDSLTGDVVVLESDIVMDIGKSMNPAVDIGQIEGAFVQGKISNVIIVSFKLKKNIVNCYFVPY
ncbi:DgyrCDS8661 [Dimorphilus gyrociliatus]|uniref:DgyrCDS8661 n=1 Tax=Dimorphilus gyrociliatus TaxID=2664684 RepID=A0A7I8VX00_9ANNE|nr:DgyrCDS8661 [Dimorphilus gyrociliatus]